MEEIGFADCFDFYLFLDPIRAFSSHSLLLKLIGKLQPVGFNDKGLLLSPVWIKAIDEGRFTKEELKTFDPIEPLFECIVSVDCKVRRRY